MLLINPSHFFYAMLLACSVALPTHHTAYEKLDTELQSNNTWRSLVCFVTPTTTSLTLLWISTAFARHTSAFSPSAGLVFSPEIWNSYRGITRQARLKSQHGFSWHKGLKLGFCWTSKAAVEVQKRHYSKARCDWASLPTPPLMLMTATCQL